MNNRSSYLVLLLCVLFSANRLHAGEKNCKHHGPGEDIYKHYTGTIGDRKVALDLKYGYCGASNYGGSYVYDLDNGDVKIITIYEPSSFEHNTPLHAKEHYTEDSWGNEELRPTWDFTITGDKLTGKWQSADKKKSYDINLKEDYKSAYPLDMLVHVDSVKAFLPDRSTTSAEYDFIGVKPSANLSKEDADFISTQLSAMAGGDKNNVSNIQLMPALLAHKNLDEFRLKCREIKSRDSLILKKLKNSRYNRSSMLLLPLFNDNGFLVMECDRYNFSFYSTERSTSYTCFDVTHKRVWKLSDIMTVDKTVLTNFLKDTYRNDQKPKTGDKVIGKIVLGDNFILVNKGIIFCCPFKDGLFASDIKIFVPYEKLSRMLTKEFKERMGL